LQDPLGAVERVLLFQGAAPLTFALALATLAAAAPPTPKKPTDAERGKELYERHCTACHGATAAGDGPAASALVVPVPDLRGLVDASAPRIDVVRLGRGTMPAFEASFDAEDAKRVLQYMANQKETAAEVPAEPADAAAAPEDAQPPDAAEGGD
jgi:mono/diheme cytochrome c family protein